MLKGGGLRIVAQEVRPVQRCFYQMPKIGSMNCVKSAAVFVHPNSASLNSVAAVWASVLVRVKN